MSGGALMYGMPPMGPRDRVVPDMLDVGEPEMNRSTITSDVKDRIAWLKREIKQVEAWKEELALLEKTLATLEPPKKAKRAR